MFTPHSKFLHLWQLKLCFVQWMKKVFDVDFKLLQMVIYFHLGVNITLFLFYFVLLLINDNS